MAESKQFECDACCGKNRKWCIVKVRTEASLAGQAQKMRLPPDDRQQEQGATAGDRRLLSGSTDQPTFYSYDEEMDANMHCRTDGNGVLSLRLSWARLSNYGVSARSLGVAGPSGSPASRGACSADFLRIGDSLTTARAHHLPPASESVMRTIPAL